MEHIQEKIADFKNDLIKENLTHEQIFQRHIVDGKSYFFHDILNDYQREYKTRSLIASYLNVHIQEVIIVGSSKLGYSLSPDNLFRPFDSKFVKSKQLKDKSDIDVAVISNSLFEDLSKRIFEYTNSFKVKWDENEYYFGHKKNLYGIPIYLKYFEYFSKGWFRPDMKPKGFEFCIKDGYQGLKSKIFSHFNRSLGLGVYKDWYYFKHYHIANIKTLSHRIKSDIL